MQYLNVNKLKIFFIIFLAPSFIYAGEPVPKFEEIFVTAEKKSENLQDLSQAVTALTGDDLDDAGISSFIDLSAISPGVNVAKNEGFKTVITIRGIGNEANQNAIANPSVSYHLDGVYIASPFSLQTDFLDLERVEVLRGPQGTLFGQNSTAGAINVITSSPSIGEAYGKADVTIGSYNLLKTRATYNFPISDNSALKASVSTNKRNGYTTNLINGQDLDDADSMSARLRYLFQPTDDFSINLTAQYFDEKRNGAAAKGILDDTPNARELKQDSLSEYDLNSQLYSAIIESVGDTFTFKSITSYQEDDILIRRDNDRHDYHSILNEFGVPANGFLKSYFNPETNKQTTYTQEFNWISNDSFFGMLDVVAGLFYLNTEVDIHIMELLDNGGKGIDDDQTSPTFGQPLDSFEINGDLECFTNPANYEADKFEVQTYGCEVGFVSSSNPKRTSASAYAQGTFNIKPDFRAIIGLRYTDDEVESQVVNFFERIDGTEINGGNGYDNPLQISGEKTTGRIAFEYDIDSSSMGYASYTLGFKPGGTNLTFGEYEGQGEKYPADIVVQKTYEDETVNAYEIGYKADIFDGLVRLNTAAFFYDYEGLQYQATDPEMFRGGVSNIPEAEISGLEIEFSTYITDDILLDGNIAYIDTEITEDHEAIDNVLSDIETQATLPSVGFNLFDPAVELARYNALRNVKGNELAKTPQNTRNLALSYLKDLAGYGEMKSRLQYTYRGDFNHRIFNNPDTDIVPAYETFDFTLGFYPSNGSAYIEFIARNITDKDGINARMTDVFGVGATGDELIPPERYMIRLGTEL